MANIGFYSRHLTDEDVDQIGAATRSLINKGAGQVKVPFYNLTLQIQSSIQIESVYWSALATIPNHNK